MYYRPGLEYRWRLDLFIKLIKTYLFNYVWGVSFKHLKQENSYRRKNEEKFMATGNYCFLPSRFLSYPPLLAEIEKAGVKREAITILVAIGFHRPNEGAELVALVGTKIVENFRIVNHFSKNADDMILVGKINDSIPALINHGNVFIP